MLLRELSKQVPKPIGFLEKGPGDSVSKSPGWGHYMIHEPESQTTHFKKINRKVYLAIGS